MSATLEVSEVGLQLGGARILEPISFALRSPQHVALLGPNGAGKSTLMSILAGVRGGYEGSCRFQGKEVREWGRREFTRRVSFVPQAVRIEFPFTSEQVVLMGRTPHCAGMFETGEDWKAVEEAIRMTDVADFRRRDFRTLSGGEKQRVLLASALAQSPEVLLLDEPTAFLDLRHQIELYRLLRRLCGEGLLVVTVTHDLNLAAAYCDRAILLSQGRLAYDDVPERALRRESIAAVYGVEAEVRRTEAGRPWISYGG